MPRIACVISTLTNTLDDLVWGRYLEDSGRAGRLLGVFLRYCYGLIRDIFQGQLTLRAMSLVYTTLLSVVPLIAFSFSVLKGFGVQKQLEPYLFDFLAPLGESRANEIQSHVMRLVEEVNGGLLGGISLAFFIYTAISMVQKVEMSLNYVWYVSEPRAFARRFTDYTIILLVGPLLVVIALGMIGSLQNDTFVQALLASDVLNPLVVVFGKLMPYLIITIVFTMLYKYMPNTHVRVFPALVGGLAGGFLWVALGALFASFIVDDPTSNVQMVYRSFAIAVLALIWLYLSWLALLVGAQVAFYVQNPAYLRVGRREPRLSNVVRERLALDIMVAVGRAFRDADRSVTLDEISNRVKIPTLALAPVVDWLEESGLLLTSETETLIPGKDPSRIRLTDIIGAARTGGVTGSYRDPIWNKDVEDLGRRIDEAIDDVLGDTTLAGFIEAREDGQD